VPSELPQRRSHGTSRHTPVLVASNENHHSGHGAGTLLADLTLLASSWPPRLARRGSLSTPWFVAVCVVAVTIFEPLNALRAPSLRSREPAAAARLSELLPADKPSNPEYTWRRPRPSASTSLCQSRASRCGCGRGRAAAYRRVGVGKSTVLRAITGSPAAGVEIRLGDIDPATITPEDIAGRVTLVAQDAHVFDGTIRENLLLAIRRRGGEALGRARRGCAGRNGRRILRGPGHPGRPGGERCQVGNAAGCRRAGRSQRTRRAAARRANRRPRRRHRRDLLVGVRAAVPDACS